MILVIISIIVVYIAFCIDKGRDQENAKLRRNIALRSGDIYYFDGASKCYRDPETGVPVEHRYGYDVDGKQFEYTMTVKLPFTEQRILRAQYLDKNRRNDPIRLGNDPESQKIYQMMR
ncbi:hypothetical protein SAMN02910292_02557 [Lachnospiraceae bacterium XBB2008]|nr:hypothetical protein SAMN02910292_02557 [Lachnospiraceae bacterium XBB2008]